MGQIRTCKVCGAIGEESELGQKYQLLTIKETAGFFRISETSLRNHLKPKAKYPFPVKPIKIRSAIRFDMRDIEHYLASLNPDLHMHGGMHTGMN